MNIVSLFDGMSCGQQAAERLGIKIDNYFASEIKPTAIKCTQYNYPGTIQLGNVRDVNGKRLGKIDLLIGGSPCQDFSQANKQRLGLKGNKSSLFYEYLRVLKEAKPDYFFLENVAMEPKQYAEISNALGVQPIAINSSLVSAQSRPRVYWTNIRTSSDLLGMQYVDIPRPKDRKIMFKDILEFGYTPKNKSRTLLESDSRPLSTPVKMFHRWYSSGFTNLIFESKDHYEYCCKDYDEYYSGMSASEIGKENYPVFAYDGVRYLTQTELERLQTVKEGYTSCLTRNEAAGLLGDGWTVEVIKHLFQYLI